MSSLLAEVSHDEAKMPRRERPLLAGNRMSRKEGYKITFIVQHKTRAHGKLGPDPAFSLFFHENRGVPNFRP